MILDVMQCLIYKTRAHIHDMYFALTSLFLSLMKFSPLDIAFVGVLVLFKGGIMAKQIKAIQ